MNMNDVLMLVNAGFSKDEIIAMNRLQSQVQPQLVTQPQSQSQVQPQVQPQLVTQPQSQVQPQVQPQLVTQPQSQTYPQSLDVLEALQRFNRGTATFDLPPQRTSNDVLTDILVRNIGVEGKKGDEKNGR